MNTLWLETFLFAYYPYICLTAFLLGSLIRFDRDQYTWKSDSSQLLRAGSLRWGSNLFHVGILFLLFGHTVGMLTPHALYSPFIESGTKQLLAILTGGAAGLMVFVGLTMLLHRRLADPRIRINSRRSDILVLVLLWLQVVLGLATIPLSMNHLDGTTMLKLAEWAQRIATFRPIPVELLQDTSWVFKTHMFLGMTLFLLFPFTRLVHIWSGFATVAYLVRPYQLVRTRRALAPSKGVAAAPATAVSQPLEPRADPLLASGKTGA